MGRIFRIYPFHIRHLNSSVVLGFRETYFPDLDINYWHIRAFLSWILPCFFNNIYVKVERLDVFVYYAYIYRLYKNPPCVALPLLPCKFQTGICSEQFSQHLVNTHYVSDTKAEVEKWIRHWFGSYMFTMWINCRKNRYFTMFLGE